MQKLHVAALAWRPGPFLDSFRSNALVFQSEEMLACTNKESLQSVRSAGKIAPLRAFSAQAANDFFRAPKNGRELSIGRSRNLLMLASRSLSLGCPLVFLDDDVYAERGSAALFRDSLAKCDLAQGAYSGCTGNGIYALAYFFEFLEANFGKDGFYGKAGMMLRGVVEHPERGKAIHGMTGGLFGVSPLLKCALPFFPTIYPFDDHFFEFSARFLFKSASFMGSSTQASGIPLGVHRTVPAASPHKLVDNYVLYAKSAVVESYAYFRLCGAVPSLENGHHVLKKCASFDPQKMCGEIAAQAALGKFRSAASHYLSLGPEGELGEEIGRISVLSQEDFFIPEEELALEWSAFEEEREWLSEASKVAQERGDEARRFLFG